MSKRKSTYFAVGDKKLKMIETNPGLNQEADSKAGYAFVYTFEKLESVDLAFHYLSLLVQREIRGEGGGSAGTARNFTRKDFAVQ